jgi:hypothetical protein
MKKLVPILILAVAASAATVSAQSYYGTLGGMLVSDNSNVNIYFGGYAATIDGSNPANGGPYTYNFQTPITPFVWVTPTPGSVTLPSSLTTQSLSGFCMDLTQPVSGSGDSGVPIAVENVGAVANSNLLDKSYVPLNSLTLVNPGVPLATAIPGVGNYITQLAAQYIGAGGNPSAGASTLSSAFQMALWAVTTDPYTNIAGGGTPGSPAYSTGNSAGGYTSFSTVEGSSTNVAKAPAAAGSDTLAAEEIANFWLAELNTPSVVALPNPNIYSFVPSNGTQIQGLVFANPLTFTPEPVGLVGLAGLALCGLPVGAYSFYRRRARVRAA